MKLSDGLKMTQEERIEWARKKTAVIDAARQLYARSFRPWPKELADLMDAVEKLDGPFKR